MSNKKQEVKEDKIFDIVQLFALSQENENVEIKRKHNGDGTILKALRNESYEFLEIKYGESYLQMNVKFTLHKGEDDKLIDRMKQLAEEDKDDWDRFFIDEENNQYGAILLGLEQFEEMFSKMYSYL